MSLIACGEAAGAAGSGIDAGRGSAGRSGREPELCALLASAATCLCRAQLSSVRRGCQGEAEGRSSSRGLRQVRAPSHNRVQCAHQGDAVRCMGVAFGVHAACSMRMRY